MHENLHQFKLAELRLLARDLNLSVSDIRKHGDLRYRDTWIAAIASAISDIESEAIAQKGTISTSGQNDQNFTPIQNEVGFIDGQLARHIPLAEAQSIANLVQTNRWGEAFQLIHDNTTATRILQGIQELQQLREVAA